MKDEMKINKRNVNAAEMKKESPNARWQPREQLGLFRHKKSPESNHEPEKTVKSATERIFAPSEINSNGQRKKKNEKCRMSEMIHPTTFINSALSGIISERNFSFRENNEGSGITGKIYSFEEEAAFIRSRIAPRLFSVPIASYSKIVFWKGSGMGMKLPL